MCRSFLQRSNIIFIILTLLFLSICQFAAAAQIRIAWNSNGEPDLAGYNIYYGTASRVYGSPINAGNVTTYTLIGLTQGQTYFIALTASDASNNESVHSTEVSAVATEPPQTYTIATNPSSLQVAVDGVIYTSPQSFSWVPGSPHTLSASSPQPGVSGVRYVYASWSDGGTQSHNIIVPSLSAVYTASPKCAQFLERWS